MILAKFNSGIDATQPTFTLSKYAKARTNLEKWKVCRLANCIANPFARTHAVGRQTYVLYSEVVVESIAQTVAGFFANAKYAKSTANVA